MKNGDSQKKLARFEASILEASLPCIELVQTHLRFLHCTWLKAGMVSGTIVDLGPLELEGRDSHFPHDTKLLRLNLTDYIIIYIIL